MSKPRFFTILCFTLTTAACGRLGVDAETHDLTQPLAGRCSLLEGRSFETVDAQQDCGPAPAGSQLECRWRINFATLDETSSAFVFHSSDVGAAGRVVCTDGVLVEINDDGTPGLGGSYDPNTELLEWDGIEYRAR